MQQCNAVHLAGVRVALRHDLQLSLIRLGAGGSFRNGTPHVPDGAGGAFVIVENVDVGARWTPSTTWLGFQINAAYPAADVYPHYVGVLSRVDGRSLGDAISATTWQGRPALQLSRRSNGWNPAVDTAANKAERILRWLADR